MRVRLSYCALIINPFEQRPISARAKFFCAIDEWNWRGFFNWVYFAYALDPWTRMGLSRVNFHTLNTHCGPPLQIVFLLDSIREIAGDSVDQFDRVHIFPGFGYQAGMERCHRAVSEREYRILLQVICRDWLKVGFATTQFGDQALDRIETEHANTAKSIRQRCINVGLDVCLFSQLFRGCLDGRPH